MKRVAIVHDWLTTIAGAERVLEQLVALYPAADLYCVCDFLPRIKHDFLGGKEPQTTFIQNLPWARTRYRSYLPLMPLAIEQIDLSGYDLVISSSHAVAKGVLTGPDQLHVSYVHTPIRYAWDLQHQYLREAGLDRGLKGWLARYFLHRIRSWDTRTANGVDCYIANSNFIARRIRKAYRREAEVIYPPVDVDMFAYRGDREDYYVTASRLVPYKRVDLIAEAFSQMPKRRLKIVGEGPELAKLKGIVTKHHNIELLDYLPSNELAECVGQARAFVFAAEEDFGIAPVEAQACGTPVIAYGRGGALETVRARGVQNPTGVFFAEQTPKEIIAAVDRFETGADDIRPEACRRNAERFSVRRFRDEFSALVTKECEAFGAKGG